MGGIAAMRAVRQLVFLVTFIDKPMRAHALRNSKTAVRCGTATGRRCIATLITICLAGAAGEERRRRRLPLGVVATQHACVEKARQVETRLTI
jgi:hypothetical protein